jgi:hypothetical protein
MLLPKIEKHLRATGMTPTRFGRESVNDPRLVFDLRAGREPRFKINQRVMAFIQSARDNEH